MNIIPQKQKQKQKQLAQKGLKKQNKKANKMKKIILVILTILISFSAKANDKDMIAAAYNTIIANSINEVSAEDIMFAGIKGLSNIDSSLKFSNTKKRIYLYQNQQRIGLWKKPQTNNDFRAWLELTNKIIDDTKKQSQKLKDFDYKIADNIILESVKYLNDDSNYYPTIDEQTKSDGKNRNMNFFSRMIEDKILYLRIGQFDKHTIKYMQKAINNHKNAQGIILDLRGNPGGALNVALRVAQLFIDDGIITSVRGTQDQNVKYYTSSSQTDFNLPMAILIDGQTASSAEVLTAALKEQLQADLVGTSTFGKGSVQEMYSFENGGKLALTSAYFYTPSGKKIDKVGIFPDFCTYRVQNAADKSINNYSEIVCGKENRSSNESDVDLAVSIINSKLIPEIPNLSSKAK